MKFFRCIHWLASGLLGLTCTAHASLGMMQLPAHDGFEPLTVFYPSDAAEQPVTHRGAERAIAQDGPVAKGNGRLIVISHGSGGSPWPYADLARTLVTQGFVVAMPEHQQDNWRDDSHAGPESWQVRPLEISRAIDHMGTLPAFAKQLDLTRVGMYGMSAGGHTALTLAGGRWSAATLNTHCQAHIEEDYSACTGPFHALGGGWFDGLRVSISKWVIRWRLHDAQWQAHTDPRIRAIVAGVPFAADFDLSSFAQLAAPLALIQAQKDVWLNPTFHSKQVLAHCPQCELLLDLPTGSHGALLSPLPGQLGGNFVHLLADPPEFKRDTEVPRINHRIADYFLQHLLP